jgi:cell division septation protein DedD/nucleoid DNA-binding protein
LRDSTKISTFAVEISLKNRDKSLLVDYHYFNLTSVIALARHIESLLLKHDCVIVPNFGGFVTQQVSARFVEDEGLFLPPYRSVGFNGCLKLNDGLLVQSYMNAYGIGYVEALQQIEAAVAEVKAELHANGSYELGGIGVFTLTLSGTYDFQPCEAGVVSPELYGLDAFIMRKEEEQVEDVSEAAVVETERATKFIERSETHYTIRIRRDVVNYVAAAVVMFVCFFAWSVPVSNSTEASVKQAALFSSQIFASKEEVPQPVLVPATTFADESEVKVAEKDTVAAEVVEAPKVAEPVAPAPAPKETVTASEPSAPFTLVVCSHIPQKSADALVAELQSQGVNDVEILVKKKVLRVIVGAYPTEEAAHEALREYRKMSKRFAQAWVFKK